MRFRYKISAHSDSVSCFVNCRSLTMPSAKPNLDPPSASLAAITLSLPARRRFGGILSFPITRSKGGGARRCSGTKGPVPRPYQCFSSPALGFVGMPTPWCASNKGRVSPDTVGSRPTSSPRWNSSCRCPRARATASSLVPSASHAVTSDPARSMNRTSRSMPACEANASALRNATCMSMSTCRTWSRASRCETKRSAAGRRRQREAVVAAPA